MHTRARTHTLTRTHTHARAQEEESAEEVLATGGFSSLMRKDSSKAELLLRHGAYAILDEEAEEAASKKFCEQDIDHILSS